MSLVRMRNTMKGKLHLIMLGLAVVFAVGWIGICLSSGGSQGKGNETVGLVARVNDQKIDRDMFEQRAAADMKRLSDQGRTISPFDESQLRGRTLDEMIAKSLRARAAKEAHVKASRRDVNAVVDQIIDGQIAAAKSQLLAGRKGQMTDQMLEEELRKRGLTLSGLKTEVRKSIDLDAVREQVVMEKLVKKLQQGIDSSDKAVKASFDEARFRQITVDAQSRTATQAEQRAKEISDKLKGGADFAATAAKYSDDGYKDQGGDRGMFMRRSYMDKAFADKVFSLKPGEISEPIKLPQSYIIVKAEETRSALPKDFSDPRKLQEYRNAYLSEMQFAVQSKFFNDIQKNAKITVFDPELKAYMAGKEMAMATSNPILAKAKALEAIDNLQRAISQSGGDSQTAARLYSQIGYIYAWMRKPEFFRVSKEERLKYRALEKKAAESALEYTEANDLRVMLADIAIEEGRYAKAVEHLQMVSDNVFDDAAMHTELSDRLKKLKAHEPQKVAALLAIEQQWSKEFGARMKGPQGRSTMTSQPFKVGGPAKAPRPPKPGG